MLAQSVNHVTLDNRPSPTKSNGDSTDAKQTERLLKGKGGGAERWGSAWQNISLDRWL